MFFQDKVSKNQFIKQCENEKCKEWFIAKSPKAQYCSTTCASSVRVGRFREKKKGEKEKL
jgi:predicted RNA-binding Zn ribbon-like protein